MSSSRLHQWSHYRNRYRSRYKSRHRTFVCLMIFSFESVFIYVHLQASPTFDKVIKLRADLLPTGLQVMKFFGRYVKPRSDTILFDWDDFVRAVNAYAGNDLRPVPFEKPNNASLVQDDSIVQNGNVVQISSKDSRLVRRNSDIPVTAIVGWIVSILRDLLGVAIDVMELTAEIEEALTGLEGKGSSSWEYRIVLASPHATLSDVFLSLVTTIKLEADIRKESSWGGLGSIKRFSATITALKLIVTKGFKDPSLLTSFVFRHLAT